MFSATRQHQRIQQCHHQRQRCTPPRRQLGSALLRPIMPWRQHRRRITQCICQWQSKSKNRRPSRLRQCNSRRITQCICQRRGRQSVISHHRCTKQSRFSQLKSTLQATNLPNDCTGKRLIELPDTFEKMGWTIAAKLMRHWFAHPASTDKTQTPSVTLNQDWLMQSPPYADKYNELTENLWNDAAQNTLKSILERDGIVSGEFDYTQTKEMIIEKHHQSRTGGDYWYNLLNDPQDFDAAIGRYTLYAAAKGSINNGVIDIDSFAIVMRDNYDFEGNQRLGYFDCQVQAFSTTNFVFEKVENASFSRFRTQTKQGGDFYVYSNPSFH